MEIAVLVGPQGETAPIQTPGEIQVYQYTCNSWEICRSMPFALEPAGGLPGMRAYLQTVIEFLGECRIFVGCSVTGVPFFELEKAGFATWEIIGHPLDFLDGILKAQDAAASTAPVQASASLPELKETAPGCYSISLKEIQNCSGFISSKQVLLPILSRHQFHTLEVICSHVPPWLEVKILSGEINAVIEKSSPQEAKIIIKH
jgi:Fe-only nitrogenase accessory protein AnfO